MKNRLGIKVMLSKGLRESALTLYIVYFIVDYVEMLVGGGIETDASVIRKALIGLFFVCISGFGAQGVWNMKLRNLGIPYVDMETELMTYQKEAVKTKLVPIVFKMEPFGSLDLCISVALVLLSHIPGMVGNVVQITLMVVFLYLAIVMIADVMVWIINRVIEAIYGIETDEPTLEITEIIRDGVRESIEKETEEDDGCYHVKLIIPKEITAEEAEHCFRISYAAFLKQNAADAAD